MDMIDSLWQIMLGVVAGSLGATVWRQVRRHLRNHARHPVPRVGWREFEGHLQEPATGDAELQTIAFLPNYDSQFPAATSEGEAFLLATLAKGARRMFEFGTCSGRTAYLWALNSPPDAEITTLTLPPDAVDMQLSEAMGRADVAHALSESTIDQFVYSGTSVASKIRQLFQDSATLDVSRYRGQMDLIFVDGGHSYAYARNDSLLALEMVAPGGLIVWHDYRGRRPKVTAGVYRYLNELQTTHPLQAIKGTSLVIYRKPAFAGGGAERAVGENRKPASASEHAA